MGCGSIVGGRQQPITRWEGSWAYRLQMRMLPPDLQWSMAASSARKAGRPFCPIKPAVIYRLR